jgi:hypothetical protein
MFPAAAGAAAPPFKSRPPNLAVVRSPSAAVADPSPSVADPSPSAVIKLKNPNQSTFFFKVRREKKNIPMG